VRLGLAVSTVQSCAALSRAKYGHAHWMTEKSKGMILR